MLPFKRRQEAALALPDESVLRKPDNEAEYDPLLAAAEDLISAVQSKNIKGVAEALRAAHVICESYPHEENNIESEQV